MKTSKKHLKLCLRTCYENGATGHPKQVMKDLGIDYACATPQSISDMWQFWDCKNIPQELPKGITIEDWKPLEWVGYGLSESKAKKLADDA